MLAFSLKLEFRNATPLEYLERWLDAIGVSEDDVQLAFEIKWAGEEVSFGIRQPQYHEEQASFREITKYFKENGWYPLPVSSEHSFYYNYNYRVLAIDALPRNCYIKESSFMSFDVILCRPNDELCRTCAGNS